MAERKRRTYRIGQAASLLELEGYVLRFWETEFPQLQPLRTPKGQRLYSEDDIELLRHIRTLVHEEGLTLEGARRRLATDMDGTVKTAGQDSDRPEATGEGQHSCALPPEQIPALIESAPDEKTGMSGASASSERLALREMLAGMEQELLALRDILRQGLPPSVNRDRIL